MQIQQCISITEFRACIQWINGHRAACADGRCDDVGSKGRTFLQVHAVHGGAAGLIDVAPQRHPILMCHR